MTDKEWMVNHLRNVSNEELEGELKRRAEFTENERREKVKIAQAACNDFLNGAWPTSTRSDFFRFINVVLALCGASLVSGFTAGHVQQLLGAYVEPVALFSGGTTLFLILVP